MFYALYIFSVSSSVFFLFKLFLQSDWKLCWTPCKVEQWSIYQLNNCALEKHIQICFPIPFHFDASHILDISIKCWAPLAFEDYYYKCRCEIRHTLCVHIFCTFVILIFLCQGEKYLHRACLVLIFWEYIL